MFFPLPRLFLALVAFAEGALKLPPGLSMCLIPQCHNGVFDSMINLSCLGWLIFSREEIVLLARDFPGPGR